MPKYRVIETSFIGNTLQPAGAVVDVDYDPGFNLEPLDDAAEQRKAAVADTVGKRPAPGDPLYNAELMRRNLVEGTPMGVIGENPFGPNAPRRFSVQSSAGPAEPDAPPPVPTAVLEEAAQRGRDEANQAAEAELTRVAAQHAEEQRALQTHIAEVQSKLQAQDGAMAEGEKAKQEAAELRAQVADLQARLEEATKPADPPPEAPPAPPPEGKPKSGK